MRAWAYQRCMSSVMRIPEKTYAARVARFAYYGDEGGGQLSSPASTLKHPMRLEHYLLVPELTNTNTSRS